MTKSVKKNLLQAAAGTLITSLIAVGSLLVFSGSQPVQNVRAEISENETADLEAKFEVELQRSLTTQHEATMDAIEAQNEVLQRIEESIAKALQQQAKPVEAKKQLDPVTPVKVSPVRRHSSRWTVEGRHNYTTEFLAQHLMDEHGLDVNGYTREELQTMHDNIHNGYDAMGLNNLQSTNNVPAFSPPVRYFRYKTCPAGGCK
jgi:hypothetical protein